MWVQNGKGCFLSFHHAPYLKLVIYKSDILLLLYWFSIQSQHLRKQTMK
ncbi:hypothetical protein B4125_3836 [Bacillus paralicheniformis]|uniref:Uncharacterized protein n=1 Tax=Bacillus paralicheniformis TaxID=1648923 RepID=A0A6N2GMN3_9BACI|nr:hypothetical protein SC10_B2orf00867 [Bacillus paralicheniformis]OLF90901.1 hypothetical protein B4121_3114 [Bacillus paralicheniformis]OLG01336.1 hypothetical protein B4125_3836 [Bacillus paralicheniformis]TWJ63088.1 hypothetical protein CHCC5021_1548 [Bacillus paralicheniformis]TWJ65761.1 hypothetical protein CHCC5022_3302 [Bacillus paralicheniformis]